MAMQAIRVTAQKSWQKFQARNRHGRKVLRESYGLNLERIYYATLFALPLHLLLINILFREDGSGTDANWPQWRLAIIVIHAVLFVINSGICLLARTLKGKRSRLPGRLLPLGFAAVILGGSLALTLVDQWISTNITPFIIGTIIVGTILLLRPQQALIAYAATYLAYFFLMPRFVGPLDILMTNRINGLVACLVGLVLSLLMWINRVKMHEKDQEISRQQEELRRLAFHDSLTGLANRRLFDELVRREIAAMQRQGHVSSLIMLDIDHFKRVNDSRGHVIGDKVIQKLATRLARRLRSSDTLARFGGEEFIILLPETTGERASEVAEVLRRLIADQPFAIEETPLEITASFGVAPLSQSANLSLADFYREADQALYLAKQKGRNRVEKHTQTPPTP